MVQRTVKVQIEIFDQINGHRFVTLNSIRRNNNTVIISPRKGEKPEFKVSSTSRSYQNVEHAIREIKRVEFKAACKFLKEQYFDFEQGSSQDNPKDSENLHSPDCPKIQSRNSIGNYEINRMERIFKGLKVMLEPGREGCCIRSTVKQVMERNFPDLHKLTENDTPIVKFIPDFYLNSKAGACWVDPKKGNELIKKHKIAARDPTISQKTERHLSKTVNQLEGYRNFSSGDAVEKRLYYALKPILEDLSKARNENFAVFHSLCILKFDPQLKQMKNEKDFIIVSSSWKKLDSSRVLRTTWKHISKLISYLMIGTG